MAALTPDGLAMLRRSKQRTRRLLNGEGDGLRCPICGEDAFKALGQHVRKRHGMTVAQFRATYPESPTASETLRGTRRDQMADRDLSPYWTRARIITAIRAFVARTGQAPSYHIWSSNPRGRREEFSARASRPSSATVVRAFGSWAAAIDAAEVEPREHALRAYQTATHCRRGHSLGDAYVTPTGSRCCRTCRKMAEARYRQRKRAVA